MHAESGKPGAFASKSLNKAVVVHAGARDSYQLALALEEGGMLDVLVTDLFWPKDRGWARRVQALLPAGMRELTLRRSVAGLPSQMVRLCFLSGFRCLLLDKLPWIPFAIRRKSIRAMDTALGLTAARRAQSVGAGLVSYSYCGYDALKAYAEPAVLFQAHPHPATMRRILREELVAHPDCAESLNQEWELALPEQDYEHLVRETRMAVHYLVASSFTRASLVEHGTPAEEITVIPYGVDLEHFHPSTNPVERSTTQPLRLLFVGRINQRKGIKYLLEALQLMSAQDVHLTVCGRVVDDLSLFRPFQDRVDIRPSVSAAELVSAYQDADLFVFPSVAEGFGQVLLEALACGLPILSTTHTAAPDLIVDGEQGFIVEPRRTDLLVDRIAWAVNHRIELDAMRRRARARAELFTWERFRSKAADAVRGYLHDRPRQHQVSEQMN